MNTIKIYLAQSGRVADLRKDFPLYQGQYQNKLLNIFVPTSILAPDFTSQNEDGEILADYVASTAVKIGMTHLERNGNIKVSRNYYMRYLKTLTYQNVEYALYERMLPQEFTFYEGQGQNAPILIVNVVNVEQGDNEEEPRVISIITTQTCSLDVMQSTRLDNDETIEPSELDNINAQLSEINAILPEKQNKVDNALETNNKTVVGAINENKSKIDTNTQNIAKNTQDISTNRNDIDFLKENMQMSEEYIGQLSGSSLPTNSTLSAFVEQQVDRQPKNGDVVIYVLSIEGGTDKNYKYFYTSTGWKGYEIPPIESASNGTLGIIEGTYTTTNNETVVDISGGKILNIYVKDQTGAYRNIKEYLNTTSQSVDDILDGTSVVGEAMKALEDGLGNNIVNTYLTQGLGATKQYVRDYAMPREFNDVYFISYTGYQNSVPTTPGGIQFTQNTNAVGDFPIFLISKLNTADFELSSKNGYSNNIYISASEDCKVTFRLTTQYKKVGKNWENLNVELTQPYTLTAGDIAKILFSSPFTNLEDKVITLTNGDLIRQGLDVVTQTSTPITFNLYSNEVYPSTFNLTSQSYVLSETQQDLSTIIMLGVDGIIEANKVIFTVQDPDSFIEYRTNQRVFLINAVLPIVGTLDDTLPVYIEFGNTVYGVYSFMRGSALPITIGDLKSNMIYSAEVGYSFTTTMTYLETADYRGFAISPVSITGQQLENMIEDTSTIVKMLSNDGTKLTLQLSASVVNKLAKALITPTNSPLSTELVGVDEDNNQTMIELGDGLSINENGQLVITLNDTIAPYISFARSQALTEEQKAQARSNIGAGSGSFSGSYPDLSQLPTMNTTHTTSQTPSANETIENTVNLHKISKTGALADAIEDSTHRTVTDTDKTNWNNTSFSKLTNVPQASTGVAGIVQIATDSEAETGTNTTKAVSPKQLKNAIDGIGSVFTLKGTKPTASQLPQSGNQIGDVWYVVDESVGYIWLNDGTQDKWEKFGEPINLSNYVQFSDIINNLTSTASDKPLSALQGKNLDETKISKVSGATADDVATLDANGNVVDSGIAKTDLMKLSGDQTVDGDKYFAQGLNGDNLRIANAEETNILSVISNFAGQGFDIEGLVGTTLRQLGQITPNSDQDNLFKFFIYVLEVSTLIASTATITTGTVTTLTSNAITTATATVNGTLNVSSINLK